MTPMSPAPDLKRLFLSGSLAAPRRRRRSFFFNLLFWR